MDNHCINFFKNEKTRNYTYNPLEGAHPRSELYQNLGNSNDFNKNNSEEKDFEIKNQYQEMFQNKESVDIDTYSKNIAIFCEGLPDQYLFL